MFGPVKGEERDLFAYESFDDNPPVELTNLPCQLAQRPVEEPGDGASSAPAEAESAPLGEEIRGINDPVVTPTGEQVNTIIPPVDASFQ